MDNPAICGLWILDIKAIEYLLYLIIIPYIDLLSCSK